MINIDIPTNTLGKKKNVIFQISFAAPKGPWSQFRKSQFIWTNDGL